jgi:hypothetical protein
MGITFPRRLMTPRRKMGVRGTGVIAIMPMISRTFMIPMPYSSLERAKVKYFPSPMPGFATADLITFLASAILTAPFKRVPYRASVPFWLPESG